MWVETLKDEVRCFVCKGRNRSRSVVKMVVSEQTMQSSVSAHANARKRGQHAETCLLVMQSLTSV